MDFETAKGANPFLMDDVDYGLPPHSAASLNPFLSAEFSAEPTGVDNPFLTASFNESYQLTSSNPFASFGAEYDVGIPETEAVAPALSWEQPVQPIPVVDTVNVFVQPEEIRPNELGLSNINDAENDFLVSSDEESSKPRRPPPPRPSMPKETHDLILSVTGALEATSHHLLDRLPPTRAPSPTAFPDFHSPSPTPDIDLLGGSDPAAPSPPENLPAFPSQDTFSVATDVKAPPPRPPPARPAPPKPAPVQEDDMFDLFGTSKPPVPKSKDAILNLYSQPKPQPKDLLSDDFEIALQTPLIGEEPSTEVTEISEEIKPAETVTVQATAPATEELSPQPQVVDNVFPGDQHEGPVMELVETPEEAYIFGTGPPPRPARPEPPKPPAQLPSATAIGSTLEQEPVIFGSVSNTFEEPPSSIFGSIPQQPPEPPSSIFGSIPQQPPEPPSSIFGSIPQQPPEPPSSIFGSIPQHPPEPPAAIFGSVPAQQPPEQTPHIFGSVPKQPSYEEQHSFIPSEPLEIYGNVPEPEVPIFGSVPKQQDNVRLFDSAPDNESIRCGFGEAAVPASAPAAQQPSVDAFDAFAAKFEQADAEHRAEDPFDPFSGSGVGSGGDVWGGAGGDVVEQQGFGGDDGFDAFLSLSQPPAPPEPVLTSGRLARTESGDSDEGGFNIFIKPKEEAMPALAPPPKSPVGNAAFSDNGPRINPFDKGGELANFAVEGVPLPGLSQTEPYEGGFKRSDSQETPPTPLFDEDVSQPLEEFPRIHYVGDGWEMQLRQPNKKKITGQRFWKKIFVKLVYQGDNPVLQLFNLKEDKDPFQELPLQACYSVSDVSAQQYDQFGKIFTVKLQYIFYKERPGVRPGQVTKAERITNKLSQFAAYAIQGDYQGVKEFGSDLKKLGLPVEHAPQISQLLKLGCMSFEDLKQFSVTIEECLFKMPVHRDRALNYKMEEVQITVVDEIHVEQDAHGHVEKQIARVRLFFLGFLSGMPDVELGMNDMWRQGKEVVGRHDIIPVVTEEWIRLEAVEFHSCIQQDEYERSRTIKFKPPDACYIELIRFRIRPPKNRELPLQLKAVMCVTGNKVELRADVLVPGFASRKLGQIPCEDVMIRFPIPECWIYLFRVEKHFRYGSVKSAHRRTGKIKGIERFLGAVDTLDASLMEVTSGQAKYEHQHRAIVWRMPRLPKEGQGAYTTHNLVCRMQLTSYDQIPDNLAEYAYVEFTMPATQASHTTVRSVSLCDSPSDNPPEKYVRQLARHEYRVGIEHTQGEETGAYAAATITKPKPAVPETVPEAQPVVDSDSDSSG